MNDSQKHPRPYDVVLGGHAPPALISDLLEAIAKIEKKSSWTLAYGHDEYGDRTDGDIDDLIEAIRNGHRIRLLLEIKDYEYAIEAETLWIKNGIVYAQNTSAVSAAFKGDKLMFVEDSYHFLTIVNTNGDREVIRWNVGEHKRREGIAYHKVAIKWFCD